MTLLTPPERPATEPAAPAVPADPRAGAPRHACIDGNEAATRVAYALS